MRIWETSAKSCSWGACVNTDHCSRGSFKYLNVTKYLVQTPKHIIEYTGLILYRSAGRGTL